MTLIIYKAPYIYADRKISSGNHCVRHENKIDKYKNFTAVFCGSYVTNLILGEFDKLLDKKIIAKWETYKIFKVLNTVLRDKNDWVLKNESTVGCEGLIIFNQQPQTIYYLGFFKSQDEGLEKVEVDFYRLQVDYMTLGSSRNTALVLLDLGFDPDKIFKGIAGRDSNISEEYDTIKL